MKSLVLKELQNRCVIARYPHPQDPTEYTFPHIPYHDRWLDYLL